VSNPNLPVANNSCHTNVQVSYEPVIGDVGCLTDATVYNNVTAVAESKLNSLQDDVYQFHYVPILITLKNYLEQPPEIWASCCQTQVGDGKMHDFRDGALWKNRVVENGEMFIRVHLYSDELELCNPLGNKRNNKLSAFYFLVGNLETKYWSSLTNIQLVPLVL
jgi:hypothetical protein